MHTVWRCSCFSVLYFKNLITTPSAPHRKLMLFLFIFKPLKRTFVAFNALLIQLMPQSFEIACTGILNLPHTAPVTCKWKRTRKRYFDFDGVWHLSSNYLWSQKVSCTYPVKFVYICIVGFIQKRWYRKICIYLVDLLDICFISFSRK